MLLALLLTQPALANNIAAELVADGPARPGSTVQLALHFRPDPGWHGYWSNPGDAGYGMTLEWDLPPGWQAGEPLYPVPQTFIVGGLMNHVYEGDYAVLVPVAVPRGAVAGGSVPIAVKAQWLACTDKICVPEQATLRATIPANGKADPRFDGWRMAMPPLIDAPAKFILSGKALRLAIPLPGTLDLADPHVFIAEDGLVEYAGAQAFFRDGDALVVEIPAKEGAAAKAVHGILRLQGGDGVRFAAAPGEVPRGGAPIVASGANPVGPFWLLLLGALAGGLLLNVMPCVFPILSLKALSLARAGESEAQAQAEGLAYAAGVVLACLVLGALLLALRAAGEQVGWAFQLQEPGVVVALLVLAGAITANLAGLYELPSIPLTRPGHPSGAFATGLLAAVAATPCTGPFMAAAMGAALLLPSAHALLLFGALGLGLALPFLLLGFVPAMRAMLPRPGTWMAGFRRWMALPMGLTALALLWLAARLGGPELALLGAVLMAVLVWGLALAGRRQRAGKGVGAWMAAALALVVVTGALAVPRLERAETGAAEDSILAPRAFSWQVLAEARASGRPVFLWFTADWCLTCKVNEAVAIEREATRAAFAKAGVIAIRGDWTRRDPAITRYLASKGAAGVPLYVWIDASGRERTLPQVLTPDSLVTLAGQAE